MCGGEGDVCSFRVSFQETGVLGAVGFMDSDLTSRMLLSGNPNTEGCRCRFKNKGTLIFFNVCMFFFSFFFACLVFVC